MHSVEGIMGHFESCIPVHINEFHEKGIWFDYDRYTKPFITDQLLHEFTGGEAEKFKQNYLLPAGNGNYKLRDEFSTKRKVEEYFADKELTDQNKRLKEGLFDLVSNIILFEEFDSQQTRFHFRIARITSPCPGR